MTIFMRIVCACGKYLKDLASSIETTSWQSSQSVEVSYLDGALTLYTRICTHVCENYTFCIFFCFFHSKKKIILWNKQAAAAHNKFAQYFSLSSIFIFKNATSNNLLRHFECNCECAWIYINIYIRMNGETIRDGCCMSEIFYVFVVVGWCHLKFLVFFFDIIFIFLRLKHHAVDKSQKIVSYDLDRNFHFFLLRRWHRQI